MALNRRVQPKADIKLESLSRGWGKVYLILKYEGCSLRQLRLSSSTISGRDLPVQLFPFDSNSGVVCLPVASVRQLLTVHYCVDEDETVLLRKVIDPIFAALVSKRNTLLKNPLSERIRNYERRAFFSHVNCTELIPDEHNGILKGFIEFFQFDDVEVDVSFRVLSGDGSPLSEGVMIVGNRLEKAQSVPDAFIRRVDFSAYIPLDTKCAIVWAAAHNNGETIAFECLLDHDLKRICAESVALRLPVDRDPAYGEWLDSHRASSPELAAQRAAQAQFTVQPFFSIIVPLYNTPISFLYELVESIRAQSYSRFELILVNASPNSSVLQAAICELSASDGRIREVRLEGNRGITENTNEGIRSATGDFLVFVDHDDTIEPDALYWYAESINRWPDTDLLYCDEDHLHEGVPVGPFFKPDWDTDLLCEENYVCHMLAIRKSVLNSFDSLPSSEFDGSQDHNLTFLIGEKARRVCHVPRVLYHWRMHDKSVAGAGVGQKSYALEAERKAVQAHLDREGIDARAVMEKRLRGRCDIEYNFKDYPLVSIIIPNHESIEVLRRCLGSLTRQTSWPNYEIVIVENNSKDPSLFNYYSELIREYDNISVKTVELEDGFDFSRLINEGVCAASGEYLLLLNNDTEIVSPNWIELMMGVCLREDVGCVGARLLYPDGTIQHMGVAVGRGLGPFHIGLGLPSDALGYCEQNQFTRQVSAVTGACMLTKRSVFDKVNGFDQALPVDYNDVDYCLRVREAGYSVVIQAEAELIHYESVSRGWSLSADQIRRFTRDLATYTSRWAKFLAQGDPYYSAHFGAVNLWWGFKDRL